MTNINHQPDLESRERGTRYESILAAAERELDARTRRRRIVLAGGGVLSVLAAACVTWLIGPLEKPSAPPFVVGPPVEIDAEPEQVPRIAQRLWLSDSGASGAWLDGGRAKAGWLIQPAAMLGQDEWLASDEDLDELIAQHPQLADRGILRIGSRTLLARDLDRDLARHAQHVQPDSQPADEPDSDAMPGVEPTEPGSSEPGTLPEPQ